MVAEADGAGDDRKAGNGRRWWHFCSDKISAGWSFPVTIEEGHDGVDDDEVVVLADGGAHCRSHAVYGSGGNGGGFVHVSSLWVGSSSVKCRFG
ncbi:hypothetical protein HanPSC8_Chr09g0359081 [Helianthus annuus]|nr:hypothetical protein HanPSC8_Chr09g0359081 [Helianthus annuus]